MTLLVGHSARPLAAAQPDAASEEAATKFRAYAKETAAAYKALAGAEGETKLTLREQPFLRWTNPVGANEAHGDVFLWTHQGRPVAVLSLYEYTDNTGVVHEHHEFCLLAMEKLSFTGPRVVWSPEAALELLPLVDAAAPAESARQRLTQMRELAGKFSADKTTRLGETRALRLLPQPVYRYEGERKDSLDGALFTFVEATDPEVFLLLEARQDAKKLAWHYALARMNSVQLRASLSGKSIWEGPALPGRETYDRKDKPYTAFRLR